ncbi:MAG: hypothetical protein ACRDJC_12350 [Thermomicrobiales bacterium]
MSVELAAVVAVVLLVLVLVQLLTHIAPVFLLDALDHLIWKVPARPFLEAASTLHPLVRSLAMAAAIVCGFGMVLSLARATGLWIVWPAAALVLFLAVGFGVAFATMLWPVTLTAGFVALWLGLGILERVGGEPTPFPEDGERASALNVMFVLSFLLATYASLVAIRARKRPRQGVD